MAVSFVLPVRKAMEDGVEWLNIFAVDNVLQRIADPVFVGAVLENQCVAGSKVVKKVTSDEKVGVMCLEDGRPSIVEYYELTEEMRDAKDAAGDPAYNFGVILNYLFRISELEKIREKNLPLHVVEKKIPYLDEQGKKVKPEAPNGYKFEQLVLDMIHEMENCLPFVFGCTREIRDLAVDAADEKLLLRSTILAAANKMYLDCCFNALRQEENLWDTILPDLA